MAQRASTQAMRRLAAGQPGLFAHHAAKRFAAPAFIASAMQIRPVGTQKMAQDESLELLAAQRRQRPNSPHLTIYRPQVTWVLSMLNRITGVALSGAFYVFGLGYLAAPVLGLHLESATLAAAFAGWPLAAKVLTKFAFALPFTFHSLNGFRHLAWDVGKMIDNKSVIYTGWTVVGLSVVSAMGLATMF